jgi:hypothetical protein
MPSIREALRFTPEVVRGTYNAAGAASAIVIPLTAANAFPSRPTPRPYQLRDAGSSNRRVQTGFGTVGTDLRLRAPLWYAMAPILPFFCTPTGPPATPLELGSFTIDHFVMLEDSATQVFGRYLGCVGETLTLSADNSPQGAIVQADMTFPCMSFTDAITATDFPEPALDDYLWPGSLAVMQHGGGQLVLDNTPRTGWNKFSISYKNILAKVYDESMYPQVISWRGRDVDFSFNLRHKVKTDRDRFLAMAAQVASFALTDGTTTLDWDFHSQNFASGVADDTPLDDVHRQAIDYMSYVTAASSDATLTITP